MRTLVVVLLFVVGLALASGASLPPVVASHFATGGVADGFMPRGEYLLLTVAVLVVAPLLIGSLASLINILPVRFVNLPNRDYWLAPERRADTLDTLRKHGNRLGIMLALYLFLIHGLVVLANTQEPPRLSETPLFIGTVVFLAGVVVWVWRFVAYFRRT
ncbi:MAG: hypothetical protein KJ634_09945 [Gammaproteobacteria bacterium]|nr:hypothetical protein [Gammaproteobacteria bacterium]MBU1415932.1 hypothetical protein [Gammaproteobacteria bacterium]